MKKIITLILFAHAAVTLAQFEIGRLTELQKTFFVSEVSGIASNSINPAGLSMKTNDDGILLAYDFKNLKTHGNSSIHFSMSNIGFSYQDVYNYNNVRLQNYSINLSVGGGVLSVGTSNRLISSSYPTYNKQLFSFDAGLIFRPVNFFSFGFLARNLNEAKIDSIDFVRNYTAGLGLYLLNETLNIFSEINFGDKSHIDDVSGVIGIVFNPTAVTEFRAGVNLNSADIIDLREGAAITINSKYEVFLGAGFFIGNSFRLTGTMRFDKNASFTRYSAVLAIPLKTIKY